MPQSREMVVLARDCEGTLIPYGNKTTLFKGTRVTIMQSLGGAFTVYTDQGAMYSVAGSDADALGKDPGATQVDAPKSGSDTGKPLEELIDEQLRTCYDPEIPHNIVDLGLIYDRQVALLEEGPEGEKTYKVDIKMTLTAPGCGMGDWIRQDVRNKLLNIQGVKVANVDVVFDPPWNPSKMNPALRRALNMM